MCCLIYCSQNDVFLELRLHLLSTLSRIHLNPHTHTNRYLYFFFNWIILKSGAYQLKMPWLIWLKGACEAIQAFSLEFMTFLIIHSTKILYCPFKSLYNRSAVTSSGDPFVSPGNLQNWSIFKFITFISSPPRDTFWSEEFSERFRSTFNADGGSALYCRSFWIN